MLDVQCSSLVPYFNKYFQLGICTGLDEQWIPCLRKYSPLSNIDAAVKHHDVNRSCVQVGRPKESLLPYWLIREIKTTTK